jgi:hypothetical protein
MKHINIKHNLPVATLGHNRGYGGSPREFTGDHDACGYKKWRELPSGHRKWSCRNRRKRFRDDSLGQYEVYVVLYIYIYIYIYMGHHTNCVAVLLQMTEHSVTHSRYAKTPLPRCFTMQCRVEPKWAEPSRAETRWLLRSKQLWQRCLTTPVNMTADNRRAV